MQEAVRAKAIVDETCITHTVCNLSKVRTKNPTIHHRFELWPIELIFSITAGAHLTSLV